MVCSRVTNLAEALLGRPFHSGLSIQAFPVRDIIKQCAWRPGRHDMPDCHAHCEQSQCVGATSVDKMHKPPIIALMALAQAPTARVCAQRCMMTWGDTKRLAVLLALQHTACSQNGSMHVVLINKGASLLYGYRTQHAFPHLRSSAFTLGQHRVAAILVCSIRLSGCSSTCTCNMEVAML